MKDYKRITYADDSNSSVSLLLKLRIPWLLAGLILGLGLSIIVSRFEKGLSENVSLAFFIPFIVYMSDAVGTQTEAIFIRNTATKRYSFAKYLLKEGALGLSLGIIFGLVSLLFIEFWLKDFDLAITVGLAVFINLTIAPVLALCIAVGLKKNHQDPALGSGPFATVIQDSLSLLFYFAVATLIII